MVFRLQWHFGHLSPTKFPFFGQPSPNFFFKKLTKPRGLKISRGSFVGSHLFRVIMLNVCASDSTSPLTPPSRLGNSPFGVRPCM